MPEKDKRKSKSKDAVPLPTSLRRSPLQRKPPPTPEARNGFITIPLKGKSSSDRVRPLFRGLKYLLPNLETAFRELVSTKIKINEARQVIQMMSDCPRLIEMSKEEIDIKAVLGAVIDYAQECSGLAMEPRASEIALVENDPGTLDIHSGKLIAMGLYHDRWEVPLTAEGIKESNKPDQVTGNDGREKEGRRSTKRQGPSIPPSSSKTAKPEVENGTTPPRKRGRPPPAAKSDQNLAAGEGVRPLANGQPLVLTENEQKRNDEDGDGEGSKPRTRPRLFAVAAAAGVEKKGRQQKGKKAPKAAAALPAEATEPEPAAMEIEAEKNAEVAEEGPEAEKEPAKDQAGAEEQEEAVPVPVPIAPPLMMDQGEDKPAEEELAQPLHQRRKEKASEEPKGDPMAVEEEAGKQEGKVEEVAAPSLQRRGTTRMAAKRPLPREALDSSSDSEESPETSTTEEEEDSEAVIGKGSIFSPAKRPRNDTATAAGGGAGGSIAAGNKNGSLLTDAERAECYWLRRTGLAGQAFRGKSTQRPELEKEDLTSCHDCQGSHIRHPCKSGTCMKSYCLQCCRHYEYLFLSEPGDVQHELREKFCQGCCPCCLDVCCRKKCLRDRPKTKQPPPAPPLEPEVRRLMALHMATSLQSHAEGLVGAAEKEAAREGTTVAAAPKVPEKDLDGFRLLCNRCAASMETVLVQCACGVEFCPECCADLTDGKPGPLKCPACNGTKAKLKSILSRSDLAKLAAAGTTIDRVLSQKGPAVRAYDYDCKLWRLPTAADEREEEQEPRKSCMTAARQSHSHREDPVLPTVAAAVAAAGTEPLFLPQQRSLLGPAQALASHGGPLPNGDAPKAPGMQPPESGSVVAFLPGPSRSLLPSEGVVMAPSAQSPRAQAAMHAVFHAAADFLDLSASEYVHNPVLQPFVSKLLAGEIAVTATTPQAAALTETLRISRDRLAELEHQRVSASPQLPAPAPPPQVPLLNSSADEAVPMAIEGEVANGTVNGAAPVPPVALPTRGLVSIPECVDLKTWHQNLPPEDYRLASQRPDGVQNYIWTPHVRDFTQNSGRRDETVQRFVERWAAGEPIIIRGLRGRMNWGPQPVMRAAREIKISPNLDVIDCSDWTAQKSISAETFFRLYTACHGPTHDEAGKALDMLKLKDFPSEDTFANKCKRHHDDFLEMMNSVMPEYMHPTEGVLNLATKLPPTCVPPDLGPKAYIAFGREKEHLNQEGDSVTRLHEDLSDAVNIMCHAQHSPGTRVPPPARCGDTPLAVPGCGGAGALWDLYRREDMIVLRQFLKDVLADKVPNCPPLYWKGKKLTTEDVVDVVHDQSLMMTSAHRIAMARPPYNLHAWLVEQYEHEGVMIPASCVHQVRNLRASIKIALDFVSPESVEHCLAQREERRILARAEHPEVSYEEDVEQRHFHDKLQVSNMVVHALKQALEELDGKKERKKENSSKRK